MTDRHHPQGPTRVCVGVFDLNKDEPRLIDEANWHLRVQPCDSLDDDEMQRIMDRLMELLEPFVLSHTVHADFTLLAPGPREARVAANEYARRIGAEINGEWVRHHEPD